MTTKTQPKFAGNGLTILQERYLLPKPDGTKETPEELVERVSWGNTDYYNAIAELDFLPNSPTLFNGGTGRGSLSACFKLDVPDTMDGIMDTAHKAALILKFGGGVGYALSAIRPAGSPISTTHKIASGPVGFMPIFQAVGQSVTQGGVREGAQMAILHCDHPDIGEFINLKSTIEKANAYNTFNISVAATDKWMQQQLDDEPINPFTGEVNTLLAEMAYNAWITGDPGLFFYDEANRYNPTPWIGELTGTNPCGEVPLLNDEPCNLASINLVNHLKGAYTKMPMHSFDWTKLERTTRLAINYLDDTLDNNTFPHPDIDKAARLTRKLGLGVMGWADCLALMHIPYDSLDAVNLASDLMASISIWAEQESMNIALRKGIAPCYEHVPHEFAEKYMRMVRNATRTCIAPTGSISILAGVSSGIEPHFAGEWDRHVSSGTILKEQRLKVEGFTPKTSAEIHWSWHIKHQAAFQKHTDLAVSKTINMSNDVTPKDIYNAYVFAWEQKCKGVTVFRDGSRGNQVLKASNGQDSERTYDMGTVSGLHSDSSNNRPIQEPLGSGHGVNGHASTSIQQESPIQRQSSETHYHGRLHLPKTRNSITHKFAIDGQDVYFTIGLYDNGNPGELFIKASKEGSTISGLLDGIGIAVSLGLQHGVPMSIYARKYTGVNFEPHGLTDDGDIRTATSVLDYIFRWLGRKFNGGYTDPSVLNYGIVDMSPLYDSGEAITTGNFCPECQSPTVMQEGCQHCTKCGWSRC